MVKGVTSRCSKGHEKNEGGHHGGRISPLLRDLGKGDEDGNVLAIMAELIRIKRNGWNKRPSRESKAGGFNQG